MKNPIFLQPPSDDFTKEEKIIFTNVLLRLYKKIKDPLTKFIFIAYFENGYTQDEIAFMTNLSQVAIYKKIKKTKEKLNQSVIKKEFIL